MTSPAARNREPPREVARSDHAFPETLREISPPVDRLWVLGPDITDQRAVAVVGTRRATPYGLEIAHALGRDLALAGVTVVSGLAVGIDAAAHRGCLSAGGRTVAVLAGGVDAPMPPRNRPVYEQILAQGGSVVSEQPPGAPSHRGRYLERNRIIAGVCAGVVVVQAADRSGARNTASWAVDHGRERFAVPGDVRAEASRGVHAILQEGAHVCTSARDVLRVLGWEAPRVPAVAPPGGTSDEDGVVRAVLALLSGGAAHIEQVAGATGLPLPAALRLLGALDRAGVVTRAGARYALVPRPAAAAGPGS